MNEQRYDIVIAGGGMIGTSLALALAPLGLHIAVVEAVARKDASQPSFDDRSTALSRSTQRMFEAMGLWADIVAASTPIRSIHVSDQGRFGFSHIDADEQGVQALGYVVINRVLGSVLQKALNKQTNVDVLCPATIKSAKTGPRDAVAIVDNDGNELELRADLLVAADGANSAVRSMIGIGVRTDNSASYWPGLPVGRAKIGSRATERGIPQVTLTSAPSTGLLHRRTLTVTVRVSRAEAEALAASGCEIDTSQSARSRATAAIFGLPGPFHMFSM